MILFVTIGLLSTIVLLVYIYFIWNFNYWKKRNVVGPKPKLIVGTFPSTFKGSKNIAYEYEDFYRKYKTKEKYVGVFAGREPQIMILAPEIAHDVYVTKFRNFYDNYFGHVYNDNYEEAFALNPFFLKGQAWKNKRAEITPALTLNRVKASYPVMEKVSSKLVDYIKEEIHARGKDYEFDAKEICQRYTVQTVSDCVYGVDAGALTSKADSEILKNARNLMADFMGGFGRLFLLNTIPFFDRIFPIVFMTKELKTFFTNLMYAAIDLRKKTQNDRVDFLNYIIQLKEKKGINEAEMLAHFISFFADGFETSATTLTNILLCLGRNRDVQARLRAEIVSNSQSDGTIQFDKLLELPLLNGCLYEALRIFPVLTSSSKICTESTTFTNNDGSTLNVNEGMVVNVPYYSFHNDEDYFPNPDKFDPERFSEENGGEKKYRDMGIYMPFGDGPRICLGQKFGVSQVKTGLCEIIRNFEVVVCERTRKDNLICAQSLITSLDGGVWLQFKELKN